MLKNHVTSIGKFFLLSFLIWLIPFIVGLFFGSSTTAASTNNQPLPAEISRIFDAYSTNNKQEVFSLIFVNNIKVAIFNIAGGVFIGIATFLSLLINGYATAVAFANMHQNGMPWGDIAKHTLPHSIELVGIWLAGAIGFSIAKKIVDAMRGLSLPSTQYFKQIGLYTLVSGLIVLLAAYIEAYISVYKN
jgi:stage II sporulation protein M